MKKVLIIDDDPELQKVYTEALAHEDITVVSAFTGKEGLMKAKEELPGLIILDIMLPGGMNGFDVAETLKRDPQLSSIPILVLTNLDSERHVAMSVGATDYLIKANTPIDQIVTKVKTLLNY